MPICTIQMPDIVAVCFTFNNQNIAGAAAVAQSIQQQRDDIRIFPIPMRVELAEKDQLEKARDRCKQRFGSFLEHIPEQMWEDYWGRVEVIYQPFYAYEEILATIGDQPGQINSMLASMERITAYLTDNSVDRMVAFDKKVRNTLLATNLDLPRTQRVLEQDSQITAIRGLLEVDPLAALAELIQAEHRARLQNRGEAHRIGLRTLRAEFLARRTDLLHQFSQHCQSQAVLVATDRSLPLADLSAALTAPPGVEFPPVDQGGAELLQRRLDNKQENLRLIQERITEFVLTTDVPLQYIQQERKCIVDIQALEQQLGRPVGAHDEAELREGPAQELLSLVALFRGTPLGEHLAVIRLIAVDSAAAAAPAETQIVRAACWLWDNFNETVRTLVVTIFDWIRRQANPELEKQVKQAFSDNPKLRRLSMDVTLRDWPPIQQFAAQNYHWPARIKHARADRSAVTQFLADTGLKANPFQPGAAQFDPLLLSSYAAPVSAAEIRRPGPCCWSAKSCRTGLA